MRPSTVTKNQDEGAIAIIIAVSATMLLVFAAFVVDFGTAYAQKRALSSGADAAALAAAKQIEQDSVATESCATISGKYSVGSASYNSLRSTVNSYISENDPQGSTTGNIGQASLLPGADGLLVSCVSNLGLVVTVQTEKQVATTFGSLAGVDQVSVGQSARAAMGPGKSITGLRPYGICKGIADQVIADPNNSHTVRFDNSSMGCGSAPGNWGVIDFNGGSNPTGEIEQWTEFGYNQPITIPPSGILTFPGNPGAPNPGALQQEMNSILDKEIAIPIFDQVTGTGQNSVFRVTGFLGVKVCAWKFNNRNGGQSPPTSCYQASRVPTPVPQDYIQVRFTSYIPVGEINTGCQLGSTTPACSPGLRVVKLAD
jgi:hypothetical protein